VLEALGEEDKDRQPGGHDLADRRRRGHRQHHGEADQSSCRASLSIGWPVVMALVKARLVETPRMAPDSMPRMNRSRRDSKLGGARFDHRLGDGGNYATDLCSTRWRESLATIIGAQASGAYDRSDRPVCVRTMPAVVVFPLFAHADSQRAGDRRGRFANSRNFANLSRDSDQGFEPACFFGALRRIRESLLFWRTRRCGGGPEAARPVRRRFSPVSLTGADSNGSRWTASLRLAHTFDCPASYCRTSGLYLMRCGWSASVPRRRWRSAS